MDAHLTLYRRGVVGRVPVAVAVCAAGCVLLLTAASLLLWRRFSGALVSPLNASALIVVSAFLVASLAAVLQVVLNWTTPGSRPLRIALLGLCLVGVVATAGSLSLGGTSTLGLTLLWGPPALATLVPLAVAALRGGRARRSSDHAHAADSPARGQESRIQRVDSPHLASRVPAPHFPPENVSQQVTRSRSEDDRDVCRGWIRASFDEGQRQQVVHLAFCPPFETLPELSTSVADGSTVEIKHAQLMPYGARVELKRDRSSKEPSSALLRFSAVEVRAAS